MEIAYPICSVHQPLVYNAPSLIYCDNEWLIQNSLEQSDQNVRLSIMNERYIHNKFATMGEGYMAPCLPWAFDGAYIITVLERNMSQTELTRVVIY